MAVGSQGWRQNGAVAVVVNVAVAAIPVDAAAERTLLLVDPNFGPGIPA